MPSSGSLPCSGYQTTSLIEAGEVLNLIFGKRLIVTHFCISHGNDFSVGFQEVVQIFGEIPNVRHHLRLRQISQILGETPGPPGRTYNRALMTGGGPVEGLQVIRRWSWVWTCDKSRKPASNVEMEVPGRNAGQHLVT
jgi:hypothetical protein